MYKAFLAPTGLLVQTPTLYSIEKMRCGATYQREDDTHQFGPGSPPLTHAINPPTSRLTRISFASFDRSRAVLALASTCSAIPRRPRRRRRSGVVYPTAGMLSCSLLPMYPRLLLSSPFPSSLLSVRIVFTVLRVASPGFVLDLQ